MIAALALLALGLPAAEHAVERKVDRVHSLDVAASCHRKAPGRYACDWTNANYIGTAHVRRLENGKLRVTVSRPVPRFSDAG